MKTLVECDPTRRVASLGRRIIAILAVVFIGGCSETPPPVPSVMSNAEIRAQAKLDPAKALVVAKDALLQRPDDPELLALYGDLSFSAGDRKAALASYLSIPMSAGRVALNSRYRASLILVENTRVYESIEELQKLIKAFPGDPTVRRQLGGLLTMVGDNWGGWQHVEKVIPQTGPDIELLKLAMDRTRPQCDIELVETALRDHPDDLRPQLGQAFELAYNERWQEAKDSLDEILRKHPDHLPSHVLLGEALVALGTADLSEWLENCPAGAEEHPDYWYALGRWHQSEGESKVAVRCYWESLRRDPNLLKACVGFASVLSDVGESDYAAVVADRANRLNDIYVFGKRFMSHSRNSQSTAVELAQKFQALGRPWEAYGWAAFAMQLREDINPKTREVAIAYRKELTPTTPLVKRSDNVAIEFDGERYPLPSRAGGTIAPSEVGGNPVASNARHGIRLENEAKERGMSFQYDNGTNDSEPGIKIYQATGGGIAVIDYDCNGFPDIYLTQGDKAPFGTDPSLTNRMYRNWQGKFERVGKQSRTDGAGFGQGATTADLNDDGFPDLLVANIGRNLAYINNGDGTFSEVAEEIGFGVRKAWSTSLAVADIDGDGYSDIYEANYICGVGDECLECLATANFSNITPTAFPASFDRVLFGNASGYFEDGSSDALVEQRPSNGLGVVAGQLDHQPGIDIYVANDVSPNQYWTRRQSNDERFLFDLALLNGT